MAFGAVLGRAAVGAAAAGVAGIGASINKAMDFDKTMRTVGATLGTTGEQQKQLGALAIKMGKDTIFGAGDASQAMLELAKGGLTTAQIQGGALASTLTLAAAGGLEMGAAATYVGNALNTFGLAAKDADSVAAALAGGANASSASVESLGQALSQVGPGAKTAGLSLQTTTAILAAFDNAGIKGSDAGTSLKTMLQRLVPQTDQAAAAMKKLGLDFTDANGQFVPMSNVAEQLRKRMGGLSDEQKSAALTTIFGSDATRAATVLMDLGAAGVDKYTKATSDQAAAQKMANVGMQGAAGAWEAFKGSVETLAISLGVKLLPLFTTIVSGATTVANIVLERMGPALTKVGNLVAPLVARLSGGGGGLFSELAKSGQALMTMGRALLPTLQNIGQQIMAVLGPAFRDIGNLLQTQLLPAFRALLPVITPAAKFILNVLGTAVVGALKGAVQVVKGVVNVITGVFKLIVALVKGDWSGAWAAVKQIVSGAISAVIGAIKVWFNIGILAIFKQGAKLLLTSWRGLWTGAQTLARGAWNGILSLIRGALGGVGRVMAGAVRGYIGMWRMLFVGLKNLASAGWFALRSAFGGALAAIRTVVSTAMSGVRSTFSSAWSGIKTIVRNGASGVVSAVKAIPGLVKSGLGSLGSTLRSAGADMIRGLIEGIKSMAAAVARAAAGVVGDAVAAAKAKLGIASPSKVFRDIGHNTGEGMALGLEDERRRVLSSMRTMITPPGAPAVGASVSAGAAGMGGGITINGNVGWMPDELERRVAMRQRDALALAGPI